MPSLDESREFIPLKIAVLTVSDTRSLADDKSGSTLAERIEKAGHVVAAREIVPDDVDKIREQVRAWIAEPAIDAIITTGGTGITSRDSTFEASDGLLEKRLEGFGELFRMLSYQEIGAAAMMSRATAGLAAGRVIASLPGSEAAVRLAMTRLVLPELGHLVQQAAK